LKTIIQNYHSYNVAHKLSSKIIIHINGAWKLSSKVIIHIHGAGKSSSIAMVVKIIIHINVGQKFIIFINKFIIQSYHPHQWCSSCVSRELSLLPGALELKLAREESG
jgi:hypothetical protein